jgi:hypothetical protein
MDRMRGKWVKRENVNGGERYKGFGMNEGAKGYEGNGMNRICVSWLDDPGWLPSDWLECSRTGWLLLAAMGSADLPRLIRKDQVSG